MSNSTEITNISFEFGPHHLSQLEFLDRALTNIYSQSLNNATVELLFIDANTCFAFSPNTIDLIRSCIIDIIVNNSRYTDRVIIQPLINLMLLYTYTDNPCHQYPLQIVSTLTTAFTAQIFSISQQSCCYFGTSTIFAADSYNPLDFTAFLATRIIPTVVGGNTAGLATTQTSNTTNTNTNTNTSTAAVTAVAAAAATTIAATIPLAFDSRRTSIWMFHLHFGASKLVLFPIFVD